MKYLIANWKSNKNGSEVESWFKTWFELAITRTVPRSSDSRNVDSSVVDSNGIDRQLFQPYVAASFPFLDQISQIVSQAQHQGFNPELVPKVAVQDISQYPAGSYTGAVSSRQLLEYGVSLSIIGHSERRAHFQENNTMVAAKVLQAVEAGITPLLCLDDPYIDEMIDLLDVNVFSSLVVAYEALHTIGTGTSLDPLEFFKKKQRIQELIQDKTNNTSLLVPVLYGGSVSSHTVLDYVADSKQQADGFLVGGASLDPHDFMALVDRLHPLDGM